MTDSKKQPSVNLKINVGLSRGTQGTNSEVSSRGVYIGWVITFLIVAGLGWFLTRSEGPKEHSVQWFLERPEQMEYYVEECRGIARENELPFSSAFELSDPEACINANEAWYISGHKLPGPI